MVLFQPQVSPWMLTAEQSLFFLAQGAHFLNGAISTASTDSWCMVILKKITENRALPAPAWTWTRCNPQQWVSECPLPAALGLILQGHLYREQCRGAEECGHLLPLQLSACTSHSNIWPSCVPWAKQALSPG